MAESTTDVRVTDWPSSGNQSLSSSKPLRCCRRFPAVPDFRRPGKLSHKYKSTGGPLPSVCLTFCFSQSTWSLSYPHFPARCIPEPPSFLPGTEKAACPQPAAYRGTGPGWRAAVLLGPTGADLPSSTEVPGLHRGGFLPGKSQKVLRLRGGGGVCVILPLPGQRLARQWRSRGLRAPQIWGRWAPTKDLKLLCWKNKQITLQSNVLQYCFPW